MLTTLLPYWARLLLGIAIVLWTTCGCTQRSELAVVTGKVTLDGQPLADAFVVYSPVSHGTTSYGKTDSGGNYEMFFTDREKGAWIGENLVRIDRKSVV